MNFLYRFFLTIIFTTLSTSIYAQQRCATDEVYRQELIKHPELKQKQVAIENEINRFIQNRTTLRAANEKIVIPVVFHVVYKNQNQNIFDYRMEEQIEILNKDFNALNTDIGNTPNAFKNLIGNLNIQFVIANRDPNGNVTSGITRDKASPDASFSFSNPNIVKRKSTGGADAWDTKKYLNIWICEIDGNILGYSTSPVSAGSLTDGFVIDYRYVGTSGAQIPYNLGRTGTHELGHYFGLKHLWGDKENTCITDDGISDTPNQYKASSGNPTFPLTDECSENYPGIMFMNYMDYSQDKSLVMFTKEQVQKMEATIYTQRASLLTSNGYQKGVDLILNSIEVPIEEVCGNSFKPKIIFYSKGEEQVNTVQIGVKLNQDNERVATWEGELNQNQGLIIEFNELQAQTGMNTITFSIKKVNGKDIETSSYTTGTSTFRAGAVPTPNYPAENFEDDITDRGFTIINPDYKITWERSKFGNASKGNYSYYINNYEYNPVELRTTYGQKDDINLPVLDFYSQHKDNHQLTFDLAATQFTGVSDPNNNWDTLQVLVSTDCWNTYDIVYNKYGPNLMTTSNWVEPFSPGNNPAFWRKERIDLSSYDGYESVRIKIRNISQYENNIFIDNLSISTHVSTGIYNNSDDNPFSLYPNPSNGLVSLKLSSNLSNAKQISWYNPVGQLIIQKEITNKETLFDFSQLAKGIYIAQILFEDGKISTQKLIVK